MKITDFTPLIKVIEDLSSSALLVFDIDETLIVAKDKILRPCGEKHLTSLASQVGIGLSPEQMNELQSLALLQREIRHTDPQLLSLFAMIYEKQIPCIALTAMPTGKFGAIEVMEKWRDEELRRFGIDFGKCCPYQESMHFAELGENPPLFYRGMLFSNDHSKGLTLKAFLQKKELRPSKVVFIEDRHPHIISVRKELHSIQIPYQEFHYVGATHPSEEISPEIVKLQFRYLLENKKWLSDVEAEALLQKRASSMM